MFKLLKGKLKGNKSKGGEEIELDEGIWHRREMAAEDVNQGLRDPSGSWGDTVAHGEIFKTHIKPFLVPDDWKPIRNYSSIERQMRDHFKEERIFHAGHLHLRLPDHVGIFVAT